MASTRSDPRGQATVEYALILLAFLGVVVALAAVWEAAQSGRLTELARDASSHNAGDGVSVGLLQDLTSY